LIGCCCGILLDLGRTFGGGILPLFPDEMCCTMVRGSDKGGGDL